MNLKVNVLDVVERAGWTAAQTLAGFVVAAQAVGFGSLDWKADLLAAGSAAVLSVLKSIGVNASVSAVLAKKNNVSPNHPFVAETDSK